MGRALALHEALNPFRKIYVWEKMVAFLGSLPIPLQHNECIPSYYDNFIKKCDGDGKWHVKVRIVNPYRNIYDQGSEKNFSETSSTNDFEAGSSSRPKRTRQHETMEEAMLSCVHHEFLHSGTSNRAAKSKYNTNLARLLPKHIYSPVIIDWEVLNNMGCAEAIEEMLEIKVYGMGGDEEIFTSEAWRCAFDIREPVYAELCHQFYVTYEFDETVTDEDLMSKKVIKFRLGGRGHTLTILEFARRLGLYTSDEIQDEGFETYFRRGLRNDDHFNINQYWSEISSENGLVLSRSSARTIRKPILRVLQKMITYGLCQRTTRYDKFITKIVRRANLLTDEVLNGLSAPIYCRSLDTTTLKELINSNGRLIAEEPAPGDPGVVVPRPPHNFISYLYDKMGRMEIRHGELERMSYRQLYHTDIYAGVFEYMAGHYNIHLGDYAPPCHDEPQQQQEDEE
ncbi:hypothetical protein Tco_0000375 [Tanacetum coccineum]